MEQLDLFKKISRSNIIQAINRINKEGYPTNRKSSTYNLVYNETTYPPKYVLSLAGYFADGNFISQHDFHGGESSASFDYLRSQGFEIRSKSESENLKSSKSEKGVDIKYFTAFFKEEEFELLNEFQGKKKDKSDSHEEVYTKLSETYSKLEIWVQEIIRNTNQGIQYKIVKKPTNQAGYFDGYLWCRIYPSTEHLKAKSLAITVGLESDFHFCVKIDTVGRNLSFRKDYEAYRGDFYQSPLIRRSNYKKIENWDSLISWSVGEIKSLLPEYEKLAAIWLGIQTNSTNIKTQTSMSLNQILYGPPGTGKTYNTINRAIAICEPEFDLNQDRKKVKKRFDELQEDGQIVFTTFHQSLGYEDFIEGIKPIADKESKKISYEVVPGIFKMIAEKAKRALTGLDVSQQESLYTEFIDGVRDKLEKEEREIFYSKSNTKVIVHGISDNDSLYVSPELQSAELRRYLVSKDKLLLLDSHFDSMDSIQNVVDDIRATIKGVGHTYYYAVLDAFKKFKQDRRVQLKKNIKGHIDQFVLIIDEINRGNVSQIFGELITLIEHSKRQGNNEALTVTLPYSREKFSVPSNLYLLGTMNTADRSVEALDVALRRRFTFEHIGPTYNLDELQHHISNTSKTLSNLLKTINERITYLKDEDHQIGHSYLMNKTTPALLRDTFARNIVPLLKEYFYNDYEKIRLVLGDGFVEPLIKPTFATSDDELGAETYQLKSIDENFDIIGAIEVLFGKK